MNNPVSTPIPPTAMLALFSSYPAAMLWLVLTTPFVWGALLYNAQYWWLVALLVVFSLFAFVHTWVRTQAAKERAQEEKDRWLAQDLEQ